MSLLCVLMLLSLPSQPSAAQDDTHFLDFSVDDFKVALMSGNFTAYILFDWPNVAFEHAKDYFSSTFRVSIPTLYVFNDTDGDGMFTRSEATYYGFLDTLHRVSWNVSDVLFVEPVEGEEEALVGMWADFGLFDNPSAENPAITDWGKVSIWYSIFESPTAFENSLGSYVVKGRLALRLNFTLEILKPVSCSGIALEQGFKGGFGTDEFLLTEENESGDVGPTEVLGSVDETVYGNDFAHRFQLTQLPTQTVDFVKQDWTVQAYYKFSSVPHVNSSGVSSRADIGCSYYTTGSELIMHTAYFLPDNSTSLTHDMFLGIDEAGFYTGVRDWLSANLAAILIATGTVVVIVSVAVLFLMYRKMKRNGGSSAGTMNKSGRTPPPED